MSLVLKVIYCDNVKSFKEAIVWHWYDSDADPEDLSFFFFRGTSDTDSIVVDDDDDDSESDQPASINRSSYSGKRAPAGAKKQTIRYFDVGDDSEDEQPPPKRKK